MSPGTRVLAIVVSFLVAVTGFVQPAFAEPLDEGGGKTLREQLEEASYGWQEAKTQLDRSRERQSQLGTEIGRLESEVAQLNEDVQRIAATAYQDGTPPELAVALDSASFDTLVEKMALLSQLSWQNEQQITQFTSAHRELTQQRSNLDEEVRAQEQHEQEMAKRKRDAESALEAVNGHPSDGFINSGKPAATPAPRNADGGFGQESCSVNDPTGGPCLTPRMLHAYNQARAVGFTHYTSCNHPASYGEHPKGRACDFAASSSGFGSAATGEAKGYGNRLAAWLVENSNALGVMYVIWYRQIWMPSTGWRNYSSGSSPSEAHTNHVHLSVY